MEHRQYVRPAVAARQLGCSVHHLRQLALQGKIQCIRTPGGHRRYNLDKFRSMPPPVKLADIQVSEATAAGKTVRIYEGIRCERDKRHRGIALLRVADSEIVFLCSHAGCAPHQQHSEKKA